MIFEKDYKETVLASSFLQSSRAQSAQSQLFILNNIDSREIQQHCLGRLKAQREKIEELASANETMQRELAQAKIVKERLEEVVEGLQEDASYRQYYADLKEEFQKLLTAHELAEFQIEQLKVELERAVTGSMEEVEDLKGQMRREREAAAISIAHLEAIIADREEELAKAKRQGKALQSRLALELQSSKRENQQLKEQLQQRGSELQQSECFLKREVQTKQADLQGYQRTVQQLKKQVNVLKLDLSTIAFDHEREREDYLEAIEQGRTALRVLKREREDQQAKNSELQQSLKHYEFKNKSLEQNVSALKGSIAKLKQQSQCTLSRQQQGSEQEISKLQATVVRLKKQIERHVEEYNLLSIECKRGRVLLEKGEMHDRQRRARLMSEAREIHKIDKEIHRLR